jgi:hypothetical protein
MGGSTLAEYNVTLKGWKALVALAVLAGMYGLRIYSRIQTVDDTGRDVLVAWLLKDYQGQGPRDIMKRLQDYKAGLPMQPMTEIKPMNIEFASLAARGSSVSMIVKTRITVDGGTPPDGQPVRYFYMTHNADRGWAVIGETTSYAYNQTLLP